MTVLAAGEVLVGVALVGIAGGYSAVQLYFVHRWWPLQRKRVASGALGAVSATASAWFDRVLEPRIPLPMLSGWSLEPETAGLVVRTVLVERPSLTVELGSGVSTLLIAYALERNGLGTVFSFDAEARFAERTMRLLEAHGLGHRACVMHAPLAHLVLDGWEGRWFRQDAFDSLSDSSVDLLLIDGPPSGTCRQARFPALPILAKKLRPGAMVIADDADRDDDRAVIEAWIGLELLNASLKILPLGKGVAIAETSA